jgi:hypothetical protein
MSATARQIASILFLLLLSVGGARAADDAAGAWLVVATSDHFHSNGSETRWSYSFDAQYRWFDRTGGLYQTLLRPALAYDISPRLSAWVGYAYVHLDRGANTNYVEHRLWQQLAWQDSGILNSNWLLRGRLEERYRQSAENPRLSLRLMLQATTPLGGARDTALVTSVESFYDLRETPWNDPPGFTQLRTFLGFQFNMSPKLGLRVGYLNQYIQRSSRRNYTDHLLYLNFRLRK